MKTFGFLAIVNILLPTWVGMLAFHSANEWPREIRSAAVAGVTESLHRTTSGWGLEIPRAALFQFTSLLTSGIAGAVLYIARPPWGAPHDPRRYTRATPLLLGWFIVPAWIVAAICGLTVRFCYWY